VQGQNATWMTLYRHLWLRTSKHMPYMLATRSVWFKYYYQVTPWTRFLQKLTGLLCYMPKKYTTLYGS